jgi:Ca2+-transporting ATPase
MLVAVREGRTIYANIRKTIHFLLATNFTEIEVMLAGIALGGGQPLTPIQLLWINLISDIFPGLALSLEPPEPGVLERPPRSPHEPIISRGDLRRMGLESAVITAGTLASYGYAVARYGPGVKAGTQTFTTLTVGQLLHALVCRSPTTGLFSKRRLPRNRYLNVALWGSLGAQALAAFVPGLRRLLGTVPLSPLDWLVALAGATVPLLVNEAVKDSERLFNPPAARPKPSAEEETTA